MVKTALKTKEQNIYSIAHRLLLFYLILFPLGQLLKFNLNILGSPLRVQTIDIAAALLIPLIFILKFKTHPAAASLKGFLFTAIFSLVLSGYFFPFSDLLFGTSYFLRLVIYYLFFTVVAVTVNYFNKGNVNNQSNYSEKLVNGLMIAAIVSGFLGLAQYIFLNDLRFLKQYGWDDHLGRLAGTFLDPGFAGIIIVLGIIMSVWLYFRTSKKLYLAALMLLVLALALTYSRASYVAGVFGVATIFIFKHKLKLLLLIISILILFIPLLPRPSSEGVKLERLFSIKNRISNYQETIAIIKEHPLFGVGYNNMCIARGKYLDQKFYTSHSCSGSDSSMLFILATTGVVGLLIFIYSFWKLKTYIKESYYQLWLASVIAVTIHSFFTNTFFYPWVMGWMSILTAASLKRFKDNK